VPTAHQGHVHSSRSIIRQIAEAVSSRRFILCRKHVRTDQTRVREIIHNAFLREWNASAALSLSDPICCDPSGNSTTAADARTTGLTQRPFKVVLRYSSFLLFLLYCLSINCAENRTLKCDNKFEIWRNIDPSTCRTALLPETDYSAAECGQYTSRTSGIDVWSYTTARSGRHSRRGQSSRLRRTIPRSRRQHAQGLRGSIRARQPEASPRVLACEYDPALSSIASTNDDLLSRFEFFAALSTISTSKNDQSNPSTFSRRSSHSPTIRLTTATTTSTSPTRPTSPTWTSRAHTTSPPSSGRDLRV
jgi:hypothetical protein